MKTGVKGSLNLCQGTALCFCSPNCHGSLQMIHGKYTQRRMISTTRALDNLIATTMPIREAKFILNLDNYNLTMRRTEHTSISECAKAMRGAIPPSRPIAMLKHGK